MPALLVAWQIGMAATHLIPVKMKGAEISAWKLGILNSMGFSQIWNFA
jgi:hypothetical protein